MGFFVLHHIIISAEALPTDLATVIFGASVKQQVPVEVLRPEEALPTSRVMAGKLTFVIILVFVFAFDCFTSRSAGR